MLDRQLKERKRDRRRVGRAWNVCAQSVSVRVLCHHWDCFTFSVAKLLTRVLNLAKPNTNNLWIPITKSISSSNMIIYIYIFLLLSLWWNSFSCFSVPSIFGYCQICLLFGIQLWCSAPKHTSFRQRSFFYSLWMWCGFCVRACVFVSSNNVHFINSSFCNELEKLERFSSTSKLLKPKASIIRTSTIFWFIPSCITSYHKPWN